MDPNKKAEIVAASFIPEGMPAVAGLTAEQQRVRARAKELRGIYDKTKDTDPKAALRRPEASAVSKIDTDKETEKRVKEATRLTAVKTLATEAKVIAEGGLDAITDPVRKQAIIDAYVVDVLDLRPEFSALHDDEKKTIAEAQLKSPEVRAKLGKLISEKFNPAATVETEVDTDRRQAIERRDGSKTSKKDVIKDITKANTQIGELEKASNEHLDIDPTTGVEGVKHQKVKDLLGKVDVKAIEVLRTTLSAGLSPESFEFTKRQVAEKIANGLPLTGDEPKYKNLLEKEKDLEDLQRLQAERDGLPDRLKTARKEKGKLEKKRNGLTQDIKDDTQTIDDLDDEVEQREIQLRTEMETIITEAGNEALDDEKEKRFDAFEEQYKKETQAAADGDLKRLRENLQASFTTRELRHGRPREVNRNGAIQTAWNTALMSGDVMPAATLELTRGLDLATPEGIQELGRIQDRLRTDPAFKKQLEEEYVTYLFQKRLEGGKPMFEGEAKLIERYSWGPYIDKAVTKNTDMQQRLDRLVGTAGEAGYYQRLRSEYGDNWISILALLAVGAVIPGTMLSRMMRKETGR